MAASAATEDSAAARIASGADGARALTGRAHHLAALEGAFAASRREAVTLLMHGPSGMGCTTLLRRFLDGVAEGHGALVLEGRSHRCQRGPYDALAPLVTRLVEHLAEPPDADVDARAADASALACLFPALARSPAVGAAPALDDAPDPHEVRRRAAMALRRLFTLAAARAPVVLSLDDAQLGDAESASLVLDLIAAPDAPRVLVVVAYRSEDTPSVDLVTALRRRMARGDPVGDVRELLVGPLAPREARTLARALLPGGHAEEGDEALAIPRLSEGNPFFVRALARQGRGAALGARTDALGARLDALPAPARCLLELIAAAGRPTSVAVAASAGAVDDAEMALARLLEDELVSVSPEREVEPSHALIRDAVLARAAPGALRAHHAALARALTRGGGAEPPEVLLFHLDASDDAPRARELAEIAARLAAKALAWGRAATLFRRALAGAPDTGALLVALANALANDGRGAEAGRAYLDACAAAPPDDAVALRLRAFQAIAGAGDAHAGLAVARELLLAVGLSLPATRTRAAASLLYFRARLSLRGLDLEERPLPATPRELARADVCGAVGDGLHRVDLVRSADLRARHLLFALEAGEPARVAFALASAGIHAAMEGGRAGRERTARLVERASTVAERAEHPLALARAAAARAGATFHQHRFAEAVTQTERAIDLVRRTCVGAAWELALLAGRWLLPALHLLGCVDDLVFRLPAWLDELTALGAHAEVTSLRARAVPRLRIARDQPSEARREADDATRELRPSGWPAPRWPVAIADASASLYEGDGPRAHHAIAAGWTELDRSGLLRLEAVRLEALHLRGVSAVAAAGRDGAGRRLLALAERDAGALRREGCALAEALSSTLLAGIARARGQDPAALGLFAEAEATFSELGMPLHEAAMRRRRGEILMGDDGRALCVEADGAMWARGIPRPDRLAAVLAPTQA